MLDINMVRLYFKVLSRGAEGEEEEEREKSKVK